MPELQIMQMDLFGGETPHKPRSASDPDQQVRELTAKTAPVMVRIAPGKNGWVPRDGLTPDKYCLARWTCNPEGAYSLVPIGGRYVRLTEDLAAELGFRDLGRHRKYETLVRLARAGYVDLVQITPGVRLLDIDSWFRHLTDCMSNPDMWEEGTEDRACYLKVNGLGGWQSTVGRNGRRRRK